MSTSSTNKKNLSKQHKYSGIYQGIVTHQRLAHCKHFFKYKMAMFVLDLDELQYMDYGRLFNCHHRALLRFNANDYLTQIPAEIKFDHTNDKNEISQLKNKVITTVNYLITKQSDKSTYLKMGDRIVFAGLVRHFGIYFSPVNFFFCYKKNKPLYMLAEVSNTPWNERHYYLVDINDPTNTPKSFHVSPFMNMDMDYKWSIKPPANKLLIGIDSYHQQRLFSANLQLLRQKFHAKNLKGMLCRFPFMPVNILLRIYWQALKLFIKKVPIEPHPKHKSIPITPPISEKKTSLPLINHIKIRIFYNKKK